MSTEKSCEDCEYRNKKDICKTGLGCRIPASVSNELEKALEKCFSIRSIPSNDVAKMMDWGVYGGNYE